MAHVHGTRGSSLTFQLRYSKDILIKRLRASSILTIAGPFSPIAPKIGRSAMHTATSRPFIAPHEIDRRASHTRTASPVAPAMTFGQHKTMGYEDLSNLRRYGNLLLSLIHI